MNFVHVSKSLFYDIQEKYLYPVINSTWEQQQLSVMEEVRQKELVNLCVDSGKQIKRIENPLMQKDILTT